MPAAKELREVRALADSSSARGTPLGADERARFRQLFCDVAARHGAATDADPQCEGLLWRWRDEPAARAAAPRPVVALPPQRAPVLVIVTGAFGDCFGDEGLPFREPALDLASRGYRIDTVRVSGRSSAAANARALADILGPRLRAADQPILLLGYSKGVADILELLALHPELVRHVAGVVSVAGAARGSPLAAAGRGWYDRFGARAVAGRCDPGDGGVIDSLDPAERRAWLTAHPLPPGLVLYTVAAMPQGDRIARALRPTWRTLARADRRNDGQLRLGDALLPGATLLALANADHWGIALRIERALPRLAARRDARPFPQVVLLEGLLLFAAEAGGRRVGPACPDAMPDAVAAAAPRQ